MRKKVIYVIIAILFILLIPVPIHSNDSHIVEYRAFLYKIIKIKNLNHSLSFDYDYGMEIESFGHVIYNNIRIAPASGQYELYTGYETCKPFTPCTKVLKYSNKILGEYEYNIVDVLNQSKVVNDERSIPYSPSYRIRTGKGQIYITDKNNESLNELLEQLDIDLNECLKPEYKY